MPFIAGKTMLSPEGVRLLVFSPAQWEACARVCAVRVYLPVLYRWAVHFAMWIYFLNHLLWCCEHTCSCGHKQICHASTGKRCAQLHSFGPAMHPAVFLGMRIPEQEMWLRPPVWRTLWIGFAAHPPSCLPVMHSYLMFHSQNAMHLPGWRIMSEVSLAAPRPRGHHCASSRKLANTTKSPALQPPISFSRMRHVFGCTPRESNSGAHSTNSGIHHVRGALGKQAGPFVGRNFLAQFEWGLQPCQ